ncbi:protein tyrosine phosphatase domain-containing protein 1 [Lepisosteus oculatus]|uniref:protein tyrosine phosphatase domain-containing protein 1 n=1 Tax=Lepisosteus oculatus TaxID=7918 RepID=UPI003713EEFE
MALCIPGPRPSYSQARENLVKTMPPNLICALTCRGKDCRYEGPATWTLRQQAIRGVFSTWVTDDILAMARPSTALIKKYYIIDQFHKLNIKSIINMQVAGEHAHCGSPLERESGFSYLPQVFMDNGIYFFNFGMPDFGVSSLIRILDGVKVLAFAVKEGKVAVHCHAGLGRTGVLVACYLIYITRVSPSEAIHYVRIKRPCSIQTRAQINLVFDFARFLAPHLVLYASVSTRHNSFTLQQYLNRQKNLLHGYEARNLKHVPKIVDFICRRLTLIALNKADGSSLHAEVEREATVFDLTVLVRETLIKQKFPCDAVTPVLLDPDNALNPPIQSVTSWEEKERFQERKRELLQNKRSYSDSDLSRIALLEKDLEFVQLPPSLVRICSDCPKLEDKPANEDPAAPRRETPDKNIGSSILRTRGECLNNCDAIARDLQTHRALSNGKWKKKKTPALGRFITTVELNRTQNQPGIASVSQTVAKAMSETESVGNDILRRAALLQGELNGNEGAWAMLAVEPDPRVLSYLLWSWLEQLKEPVLKSADLELLVSSTHDKKGLKVLHKHQDQTISCLLDCVSEVTSFSPHMEDAVLRRLMRAVTRCSDEQVKSYARQMNIFKAIVKEMRYTNLFTRAIENVQ